MNVTMEPVDINNKELQSLKSEFNELKSVLAGQRIVDKALLDRIKKQETRFIGKDLSQRMVMDIVAIPLVVIVCLAAGWPVWFIVAVSVWALGDFAAMLVGWKRFDTREMLDGDVLTVAKTVREYKKFYHLSLVIGAVPAAAMVAYILIRIYSHLAPDANVLLLSAIYVFVCLAVVLASVATYRKKMAACDNLIDSLEGK